MGISYSEIGSLHGWMSNSWPIKHGFLDRSFNVKQTQSNLPGFTEKLLLLEQVHGSKVITLDSTTNFNDLRADGWLSTTAYLKENNLILGIRTADCIPVLIFVYKQGVIAALHCGWRSIAAGIISVLIEEAKDIYNVKTDDIEILIGPGARECCYEVGIELISTLKSQLALSNDELAHFSHKSQSNNYFLGLDMLVKREFLRAGLLSENIVNSNTCSICHHELYSFRLEKDQSGRQLSFISALTSK